MSEPGDRRADVRKRRVKVDLSSIAGADLPDGADSIDLNLFPDVNLRAVKGRFDRRDSKRFSWLGKAADDPLSLVAIVAADGLIQGSLFVHGKHYAIRGGEPGAQEVVEVDQSALPNELCDQIPTGDQMPVSSSLQDAQADSGTSIDVLVVYTSAVGAGGPAQAQLGVDLTNASYSNSGITPRLRLVHAEQVALSQSGTVQQTLDALVASGSVSALRETYRADVVVLLTNNPAYCGLAKQIMATASTAFALVDIACLGSNYSFGHEIGHLQGARHDRYKEAQDYSPSTPPEYNNSNHGQADLTIRQRTVMAYNDICAATAPGTFCTRLAYWSNPGVPYPGYPSRPTGGAYENNVLKLNTTASTVADFKVKPVLTVQSTNPASGVSITVNTVDYNSAGGGTTPFTLTYSGNPSVILTAPATAGGFPLLSWTGCSSSSTVNCTVTADSDKTVTANYATNLVPTLDAITDRVINEDAALQTVSLSGITDGGEGTQTLVLTASSSNTGLIPHPTVSYTSANTTGSLSYTPVANANGSATITVTVDDGQAANNTFARTFLVTVNAVNDAPSFTKGANQTVPRNPGVQTVSGWATGISAGPADETGQTLTFQVTNDNNSLFSVQPAVASNGTLTYTPAAAASGSATVTVALKDNGGTANGGTDTSAPQTFTITVNPCAYVLIPSGLTLAATVDFGSIDVETQPGCAWTAAKSETWMTITFGNSGTGSGTVQFSVTANKTGSPRSVSVTVADKSTTITQAAQPLTASFVGIVGGVAYENPFGPATLAVTFDASGSTGPNPIASFHWDFGDGQTADSATPSDNTVAHAYDLTGSYLVTLTVTDSAGLDSTQRIVSVAEVIHFATTPAELQAALTLAGTNGKHDIIRLAGGSYPLPGTPKAPFAYTSTESKDLIIEGGWTPDFSQRAYNIPTELLNDAPTPASGNGGVLRITAGGGVTVDGITIRDGETAGNGGGLYIGTAGSIVVGHSQLLENTAGGDGGGLFLASTGGSAWVYGNAFKANNGANGGAGVAQGLSVYVYTNVVTGNAGSAADGGLQVSVSAGGELIVSNNTIYGNEAFAGGSGLTVAATGTGGISFLDVHNNIVYGNGPAADVAVTPDCNYLRDYLVWYITNNSIADYALCPDYTLDGTNVEIDFSGRLGGDIRLAATDSALIDQGTDYNVPSEDFEGDAIPLDGDGTAGSVPDIGADEYNPANVAGPTVTGVAPASPTIGLVSGSVALTVSLDRAAKRDVVLYLTHVDTNTGSPGQPLVTITPRYLKILKGATSAQTTVQALVAARRGTALITASDPSGLMIAGTATVTVAVNPPTLGTLTPDVISSAPGVAQTVSAVYSDADGSADLLRVYLKVSQTTSPVNSIFPVYDRNVNKLYLYNDAATAYVGSCTPGVAGSLTNSQGTLDCGATTVVAAGNNLTVGWRITPKPAFASATAKSLYLYARDNANLTVGYANKGDWTILAPTAPTLGTLTPAVILSAPDVARTITVVYSDANGYIDLLRVYLKVSQTTTPVGSIFPVYDRNVNKLYLYNDAATAYVGSCTPGVAGSLTNSQGTLDCGATTVVTAGKDLTVGWNITPKAAFASATPKHLYLYARDNANLTAGYADKGDWTIFAPAAPTLGTVSPDVFTSAPDVAQTITAVYSDANGSADLLRVYLKVSQTTSPVNGIFPVYDRKVNKLYLYNDAATAYVGSCTPGVAGSLSNSRGTLDCGATTVVPSGNDLTVGWRITPKPAFASATAKNLYLFARDNANLTVGYADKGDWTIIAP